MSETLSQSPILISSQSAVGRVTIASFPGYDMMVWNDSGGAHNVLMGQRAMRTAVFQPFDTGIAGYTSSLADAGAAQTEESLINGPCFVPARDLGQGYIVCVNAAGTVVVQPVRLAPQSGNPNAWGLGGKASVVTGSQAAGAPAAAMGLQNGQLVLNIVWQDAGAGGMVLAQMQVGKAQQTLSFKMLGQACIGQPSLVTAGGLVFLAWTGTDGAFNLATAPAGGVDFQFDGHYIDSGRSSAYGPCLVPFNDTQLYVLWAGQNGLQYAQLAENQFGQWGFNPAAGCSGAVPGNGALGGPYGLASQELDDNGQPVPALDVAWPEADGDVVLTSAQVSLAPVPIIQV